MASDSTALIADIQRFCIHDGPGIRTTVFFKGCPLACRWCQNPETISFQNELAYSPENCLLCGECAKACPHQAIRLAGGSLAIDRLSCRACFQCIEFCCSGALVPTATLYDCESLLAEVLRDKHYYGEQGGITLSGGEPLAQADFLTRFLPASRKAGLHVVVQTAGYVPFDKVDKFADMIDLFHYDLKLMDPARHKELTGVTNELILVNLASLVRKSRPVEVRTPLLPGYNDDEENLSATAAFLLSIGLKSITILPYNSLGESKRAKINCPFDPIAPSRPAKSDVKRIVDFYIPKGLEAHVEV